MLFVSQLRLKFRSCSIVDLTRNVYPCSLLYARMRSTLKRWWQWYMNCGARHRYLEENSTEFSLSQDWKKNYFFVRELLCAARCITVPQLFVLSRQRVWWSQRFATRASSARISTLSLAVGARAAATDVGALSVYMFLRSSLITVCKSVFAKSLKLFAHRWNPSGFRSNSKPRKYGYVYSN
jgi:hypothetical protein